MERLLHALAPEPRFWKVVVEGDVITLTSGPIHTPGVTRRIECKSAEAATKTAQQLVDQRLRDGFRLVERSAATQAEDAATERALLKDDEGAWLVFADGLLESVDRLRGEFLGLQVRAARRERGAITRAKTFLTEHFDALVGSELSAFHRQVTIDWRFGYARSVRVWSGPHSEPIADVLPAVLRSPASRFLQQLEFGSPGAEGRYDGALRALAKLSWPDHLDSLVLGNFDVVAARLNESAWPRLESLASLTPVAERLCSLDVRAVLNTLGKGLSFPKLERLVLRPSMLDARILSDLLTLEAPALRTFGLSTGTPRDGWEGWGRLIRQWTKSAKLEELVLAGQFDAVGLLHALGDEALRAIQRVDLTDAVGVGEVAALRSLAPSLRHAVLCIGDAKTVAKKLAPDFPRLDTTVVEVRLPDAVKKPRRRRLENE